MVTNVEGTITKTLASATYDQNKYYNITANLDVRNYDGDHYYMWDALEQFWKGYEWTKNLGVGVGQPTLNDGSSLNYAQSNSDVSRWYHEGSGAFQATQSCAGLPNVNEMTWYAAKGDPRWDADELWTTMGHLYKGGMWFKKKSELQGKGHYDSNTAVDGTDWRTTSNNQSWSISRTPPSAADANKYFYLPALGYYLSGQLIAVGSNGEYWSSSANPWLSGDAYNLYFGSFGVNVNGMSNRNYGFRVDGFE